ncbi:hypothetical protein CLV58_109183 [Spirosoma oryzae]|uniref:Uncharacterized protein n=1 Tax=Spirosoma oryzae TaxID=1469603 RepID=A0A2T0SYG8_9BACT|nr:hypothetical protein [Spirosoma oryzae]PRY38456.1 hypothetical protein CLV58_109183 [Spirosoma oryzae]
MIYGTEEAFIWLTVLLGLVNVFFLYIRWDRTHELSTGHDRVGLISCFGSGLCLLICALTPSLAYLFIWLGLGFLGLSLGYEYWYFGKYPVKVVKIDTIPAYKPRLHWVADLVEANPDPIRPKPFWQRPFSRAEVSWGICFFLIVFGFDRVMTALAYKDNEVIAAKRESSQVVKSVVSQQGARTRSAIAQAVDSLRQTDTVILNGMLYYRIHLQHLDQQQKLGDRPKLGSIKPRRSGKLSYPVQPIAPSFEQLDSLSSPGQYALLPPDTLRIQF